MIMKKLLLTCLSLLLVVYAYSQQSYSLQQMTAAMKCRMIKVTDGKYAIFPLDGETKIRNCQFLSFNFIYGGQSSGYTSDDSILLLADDADEWNRNNYPAIASTPTSVRLSDELKAEDKANMYYLDFEDKMLVCGTSNLPHGDNKSMCGIIIRLNNQNIQFLFEIKKCDFYDISNGQAKLVLKGYEPGKYDYRNGNLLRVFFNNMYKYYQR